MPIATRMAANPFMPASAYRITGSVTAVILRDARERLECLHGGSILVPISAPNAAGMVEATCEGNPVWVFARDLDEGCERIDLEVAVNSSSR
jgi:hypothetical protein